MLWTASLWLLWAAAVLAAPATQRKQKVLLISFDGFRWDYDRGVDTPNMDQMAEDGVKALYVTPPFLSVTSPSHFTLVTGRYVENHGVVHNMWFDTTSGQKKPYYATLFVDEWWDNWTLPLWITAQRQGLKAGTLHFPGSPARYQGEVPVKQEVEPPVYDYGDETAWQKNSDKVMGWFRDEDLDFVSLYFGEPDGTGHLYGPDSPQVREMVKQVDRTIGYIRHSAGRHGLTDHLNIIITADHGMTTIHRNDAVQEITLSEIPGFSFRDLSFHLVDYGPSGMLLPKPGKLDQVYEALKGAHPHLNVFKKEEMPERLHYSKNERILPIVLFADPGYLINGFVPVQFNKGEHGFDNNELDMKAFFRAVGPAFHKNLEVGPFESVNIYALMCHILGITPESNDGHLNATKHMLATGATTWGGRVDDVHHVFIGLAAAAGVLVVLFIALTAKSLLKNKRNGRSFRFCQQDFRRAAGWIWINLETVLV
ncbi:ectonucleotide pyrophosphatase/phosphodiesterase family member 7-like [Brachionichthys hirsutus]|uniref:ectonucleotide pyrophosphatase/phosphodiesterase family member 7-like n=1 Tax=Brachionichthys hirsutus TaxID=412623 RepID=UPI00360444C7